MAYDTKFRPTTQDVAVWVKNRTVDGSNNYIGDFTPNTIVTDTEVERAIDEAGELVLASLHWDPVAVIPPIPDDNVPAAKFLIALFSAIIVEMTKFSEQIARGVSPYPYLREVFDNMLSQKQEELGIMPPERSGRNNLVDLIARQYGQSVFLFPDDPMVGWKTAF